MSEGFRVPLRHVAPRTEGRAGEFKLASLETSGREFQTYFHFLIGTRCESRSPWVFQGNLPAPLLHPGNSGNYILNPDSDKTLQGKLWHIEQKESTWKLAEVLRCRFPTRIYLIRAPLWKELWEVHLLFVRNAEFHQFSDMNTTHLQWRIQAWSITKGACQLFRHRWL